MARQTKCYECWGLNGRHWEGCATRGYSAVGPHPDAPKAEPSTPEADGPLEMCCGGTTVRAVCEFHKPPATAPAPLASHAAVARQLAAVRAGTAPIPPEWVCLGPDDPAVSADTIYKTPAGTVVGVPS